MFKNKKTPVRIRVRYEILVDGEIRGYEADAEIVVHGNTGEGITQAVTALGLGLLDLSDADRSTDWRNRPRFGGNGDGDGGAS
jgi:hypothetical protein